VVGSIIKNKKLIGRYYFWNDYVREVDYDRVKDYQKYLRGRGGTDTTPVARLIVKERLSHIILITDAEVDNHIVEKTDAVFEAAKHNFKITSSICYIISSNHCNLNMSTTCPFTRYGDSYVYMKNKSS
jgi:hypothetical protein